MESLLQNDLDKSDTTNSAPGDLEDLQTEWSSTKMSKNNASKVAELPELCLDGVTKSSADEMEATRTPADQTQSICENLRILKLVERIGGLSEAQIRAIPPVEINALTLEEQRALSTTQIGYLDREQIGQLRLEQCTNEQLAALSAIQIKEGA